MLKVTRFSVLVVLILIAIPFQSAGAAVRREAIQTRADNHFVETMQTLAAAYDFAVDLAVARGEFIVCPVPNSTFVASFGAPRSGHTHQGTDMMAPDGSPIYAPQPGYYRQHGNDSFYLDANDGTQWFGTHLQEHVRGDGPVAAGELVALVGHTGNASASGPHLHLEQHPGGGAAVEAFSVLDAACNGQDVIFQGMAATPRPAYRFHRMEVHRWWNENVERIDGPTARVLTRYLNVITLNRIIAYVRAVAAAQDIPYEANWDRVANCESGGNWSINTGNGFYGGLQFDYGTWQGAGGGSYAERADLASKREQVLIAERVRADRGLSPWPHCGDYW